MRSLLPVRWRHIPESRGRFLRPSKRDGLFFTV